MSNLSCASIDNLFFILVYMVKLNIISLNYLRIFMLLTKRLLFSVIVLLTSVALSACKAETAFEKTQALAYQGNATAQTSLGIMYENGQGVIKDYQQAVYWYEKAAKQGYVLAINWFKKAADQDSRADEGDAEAQHNLGVMYYFGQGLPQSYKKAYMWANIAASNGEESHIKDFVAKMLSQEEISQAQDMAKECLASNYKVC